jgi:dihydrolipoamide dehydrogenase
MKDLIIIGGGPGGYVAAIRARQLGMNVVLVEKDRVGGVCLNRGCIPTKSYYRNALAMRDICNSLEFNIQAENISFDMAGARERKNKIVSDLLAGIEKLLKSNGVERINGQAEVIDKNTVLVNGQYVQGRNLLLATGSVPASLPIPGIELPGVINSDQMLEMDRVPPRLAIVGGGVIGLEFACIFNSLGSQVEVFEYLPYLLNSLDNELGKRMLVFLKKQKINVHTSAWVEKVAAGHSFLKITASGKKGLIQSETDVVLVAGGRKPYVEGLNLEQLGIERDEAGFLKVDQSFATNIEGIYAIGDVIGGFMLAHVASEEGLAAVENMAGLHTRVHYHAVPACVFTIPEIASTGMSEEEARKQGIEYRTGKFQFAANGKALTMGEGQGMVKVLADKDDVIIGVHIIGPHASDLISEGTMMVKNQMKASEIAGVIHPHPTLGEALIEAVLDVHGQAIHLTPPGVK